MLSHAQTEKLIALVGELLATDEQFSAAVLRAEVAEAVLRPGVGLAELMGLVTEGYADRPALARRATEPVTIDGRCHRVALPRYVSITYRELWDRVTAVAASLHEQPVRTGDRIATLGPASIDYTITDMAIARLDGVSVPLHAGVPLKRLQPVVDETEPTVLAASTEHLEAAVSLCLASPSIRRLLVLDHDADVDDHRDALAAAMERLAPVADRVRGETMADALERGRTSPVPPVPASDPDRLAAIIYTSGSSGSPKGAMQPDRLVSGAWTVLSATLVHRGFAPPAITLNYLPMSHTGGRAMLFSTIGAGGTAYFAASNDLSTMLEDVALVRPTQLNFIPRVWEMLHAEYQRRVAAGEEHEAVLADMRTNTLGGRYISALTGSAPISADLAAWCEELLDSHLMDALGATESGGVIIDGRINRPTVTDYKLDDVPELGYFRTDQPHRGELLIRSSSLFTGYYQRDGLTAEVFDPDGFYRTGDIVTELSPDHLRYLDRRNNVIKLSQGEFVTISRLETLFGECEPVEQLYLYGNSERPYLLAVVVPTAEAAPRSGEDVAASILRSFQGAARTAGLEPFEVPRDVIISPVPFTAENGLLTATDKLARRELRERFDAELEARYREHSSDRDAEWKALLERAPHQPVLQTVCDAAAVALGNLSAAPLPDDHYIDLGGDSLAAVSYASMLSDLLGVEVDVGLLISPANNFRSVADHIEALRRREGAARPTFTSTHGADATEVAATELTLDKFLDADCLTAARSIPGPAAEVRHVLLTGATGYLGRYLARNWLERMAEIGGTVTCLVRGKDDLAARQRLDAGFDTGDAELLARYQELAADHLQVIAGDKSETGLGIDQSMWQELAQDIDLIIDPAALVNHVLPYPQLFGPNVVGTAELIRLALTARQKPIIHVSSVAAGLTAAPGAFTEQADIRTICPTKPVDDHYASGYATSKWAGEVLLREAHDLCTLPIRIFRCDMLMAETTSMGQINVPDMVTRLLFSVAVTGLAPDSFHAPDSSGGRARSHFDGLPVDFVAEAISAIGRDIEADVRTYHVVNPHDDGIGLDEYIDWIAKVRPIERFADHREWFGRFESAIRNLPERQRQASLLPIIDAYRYPQPAVPGAFASAELFAGAVSTHGVGGGTIPGIGSDTIEKYLTDLQHLGLL